MGEKRWSKKRKQEIVDSRVQSGMLLAKSLQGNPNKVSTVIAASAIGWYGDDKLRSKEKSNFTEEDPADSAFLGDTCRQWEESIQPVAALGKRLVTLRIGIVLSADGGALPSFRKPIKMGIASILGSGRQVISWIHIDDIARLFLFAIENEKVQGVFNAVAPQPVTNENLVITLAKQMKGNFYIPVNVPGFLLKIILGEMSIEVLKSATVSSAKISRSGFQFLFPTINHSLQDLLNQSAKQTAPVE